jgi:hypothetical protein
MKRREFLKFSGGGMAAVAVGSAGGFALFKPGAVRAATVSIDLRMIEVDAEMVDGVMVKMWAYDTNVAGSDGVALGARIPGPTIFAIEGDTVRLTVTNDLGKGGGHAFAIPGVVDTGPIAKGETRSVVFKAPKAGTYLYFDNQNAPVNRSMGLHGVLVVLPSPVGFDTPYSDPTPNVSRLFADLGRTAHFPGHPWDRDRNAIWVFNSIDPVKCDLAFNSSDGIDPQTYLGTTLANQFRPQYFTINGKSGFFSAQHGEHGGEHVHGAAALTPDAQASVSIQGNVGQPVLIRNINAGLFWHSAHIHGNHCYVLSVDGTVQNHLEMVDTWTMYPLAHKDLLLPMIRPPDMPDAQWAKFANGTSEELFPLFFPMHDHMELSNTAAGGNYPQGCVTHFQINGPVSPDDEVIQVDRCEVRVKTGQMVVEGRSSGSVGNVLQLHAGPSEGGASLGTARVEAGGKWRWQGRALKALSAKQVSIHNHDTGAARLALPLKFR